MLAQRAIEEGWEGWEGSGQVPFLLAEEGMDNLVILLLAERALSEGPRSTRAIEDRSGRPTRKDTSELGGITQPPSLR